MKINSKYYRRHYTIFIFQLLFTWIDSACFLMGWIHSPYLFPVLSLFATIVPFLNLSHPSRLDKMLGPSGYLPWHPCLLKLYACFPSTWQYLPHYIHVIYFLYLFSHHKAGLYLIHLSIPRSNAGNIVRTDYVFIGCQLKS